MTLTEKIETLTTLDDEITDLLEDEAAVAEVIICDFLASYLRILSIKWDQINCSAKLFMLLIIFFIRSDSVDDHVHTKYNIIRISHGLPPNQQAPIQSSVSLQVKSFDSRDGGRDGGGIPCRGNLRRQQVEIFSLSHSLSVTYTQQHTLQITFIWLFLIYLSHNILIYYRSGEGTGAWNSVLEKIENTAVVSIDRDVDSELNSLLSSFTEDELRDPFMNFSGPCMMSPSSPPVTPTFSRLRALSIPPSFKLNSRVVESTLQSPPPALPPYLQA